MNLRNCLITSSLIRITDGARGNRVSKLASVWHSPPYEIDRSESKYTRRSDAGEDTRSRTRPQKPTMFQGLPQGISRHLQELLVSYRLTDFTYMPRTMLMLIELAQSTGWAEPNTHPLLYVVLATPEELRL
ncbi:predicted protein [Histoplasma capsulatum H143]|uniref:Uncharacterized protein n=1 Tax=Ajellomyces capsulatus (strain H143) TaxID=544712 RepID=C6HD01_AJECH|nr:predicted protein [Histoplasma capsulatum H143]